MMQGNARRVVESALICWRSSRSRTNIQSLQCSPNIRRTIHKYNFKTGETFFRALSSITLSPRGFTQDDNKYWLGMAE